MCQTVNSISHVHQPIRLCAILLLWRDVAMKVTHEFFRMRNCAVRARCYSVCKCKGNKMT